MYNKCLEWLNDQDFNAEFADMKHKFVVSVSDQYSFQSHSSFTTNTPT